jgi:hypothetical protein
MFFTAPPSKDIGDHVTIFPRLSVLGELPSKLLKFILCSPKNKNTYISICRILHLKNKSGSSFRDTRNAQQLKLTS